MGSALMCDRLLCDKLSSLPSGAHSALLTGLNSYLLDRSDQLLDLERAFGYIDRVDRCSDFKPSQYNSGAFPSPAKCRMGRFSLPFPRLRQDRMYFRR
jgi:hypothetical protein